MEALHGYPRVQMERPEWLCLNGEWEFAFDPEAAWEHPSDPEWNLKIQVPFSPETKASGIHNTGFYRAVWYRRHFSAPPLRASERLLLHFGAVDYVAQVWVNGRAVARHEGGYTPFSADITDALDSSGITEIVVRAEDDPSDLAKPRGKQDWQLEPHSIWYPRTTGIWQTVWVERVPGTYIAALRWTPSVERWELGFEAWLAGIRRDDLRITLTLSFRGRVLASDTYAVISNEVHRRIALSDPGIDDYRNELLWSPTTPNLIDASITLQDQAGGIVDAVKSYAAIRSIGVQGDKVVLNDRPLQLRMVLDQGYWPDSGLTAPDDASYRRDVELAKAMGFNGVRKHQKIENPRYLYWADVLGLLVWEEMPSAYRYTKASIHRLTREWTEAILRDLSHPCIVTWVPFNESWGVPDLPSSPGQRHYVQALYHLTRTLDATRPVIGNDGWESVATDIIGIHDYDNDIARIMARYGISGVSELFKRERPGGRILSLHGGAVEQPIMITEFGGIACSGDHSGWGYSRTDSGEEFARKYVQLLEVVRSLPLLAGFCYTQFADTYQEVNGLLYFDRTPKIPIDTIARATSGPRLMIDHQIEWEFREQLMNDQRNRYKVPHEDRKVVHDAM